MCRAHRTVRRRAHAFPGGTRTAAPIHGARAAIGGAWYPLHVAVIGVFSIKGGVGKTATAVNLAHLAAQEKGRALLWDLDPQAASSFYFRVEGHLDSGVKAIVSRAIRVAERILPTAFENLDIIHSDASYRKLDVVLR